MPKRNELEFLELSPASIDRLRGTSIAKPAKFRKRLRMNRALARTLVVSAADEDIELERLVGGDDLLPFYVLELGATLGRAVCKVGFDDEEDGTGFLIGADVLLTNNHVIWSPERAREARCIFDYQLNRDRKPQETVAYRLDPDALFLTSPAKDGLDYTFVRIDPAAGARYAPIPASRGSFTTLEKEFAHIVQHPDGKMKRVALRENRIIGDSGVTIHYLADTEGGSSGSPVFNNDWQLIGLHHAARRRETLVASYPELANFAGNYINEAIKMSAIAADLERQINGPLGAPAREALRCFRDTDSLLGYFGALGRPTAGDTALEKVVKTYQGEAHDIDIGFWNVEWFTNRYKDKTTDVAKVVTDLQLDIYVLVESSPAATAHLVDHLAQHYGMKFEWAASEPKAAAGKQSTTILWNATTVSRIDADWPEHVKPWFDVDSRNFDDLGLESVHGRVFDRYPGLFRFRARNRRDIGEPFDFNIVPLHLKAMAEGATRRRMGARILGAAVAETAKQSGEADWVIGGDFNAELATQDFAALTKTMLPLSAEDEEAGAMTYLKSPRSLIDHIFISPNLAKTYGAKDYFIVAADSETPDYIKKISDHRPVLLRLGLSPRSEAESGAAGLPTGLAEALLPLAA